MDPGSHGSTTWRMNTRCRARPTGVPVSNIPDTVIQETSQVNQLCPTTTNCFELVFAQPANQLTKQPATKQLQPSTNEAVVRVATLRKLATELALKAEMLRKAGERQGWACCRCIAQWISRTRSKGRKNVEVPPLI